MKRLDCSIECRERLIENLLDEFVDHSDMELLPSGWLTIPSLKVNLHGKKSRDATFCVHTHAQLKKPIYRLKYTSQKVATKIQRFSSYVSIFRQEFGVSRHKSQSQYRKNVIDTWPT